MLVLLLCVEVHGRLHTPRVSKLITWLEVANRTDSIMAMAIAPLRHRKSRLLDLRVQGCCVRRVSRPCGFAGAAEGPATGSFVCIWEATSVIV